MESGFLWHLNKLLFWPIVAESDQAHPNRQVGKAMGTPTIPFAPSRKLILRAVALETSQRLNRKLGFFPTQGFVSVLLKFQGWGVSLTLSYFGFSYMFVRI